MHNATSCTWCTVSSSCKPIHIQHTVYFWLLPAYVESAPVYCQLVVGKTSSFLVSQGRTPILTVADARWFVLFCFHGYHACIRKQCTSHCTQVKSCSHTHNQRNLTLPGGASAAIWHYVAQHIVSVFSVCTVKGIWDAQHALSGSWQLCTRCSVDSV